MLKALELVGFKSFADKTRFEFPDGITVVVGPNGSGKSNVVDAVKWVLGAQSAKALRGADMADVIFKGSAEGGRKPANSAEVVLVLDNTTRIFNHDSDEVHVCRRVFRSGDGEYSINGHPCRLKDVKDLFRGTGVGVDAYSLIEQGKVDRLLQSSNKDRRGIFEEAAGISRFKAKKVEAERRLQRVDQNLVRLRDIVDEVGKRLGTLKSQATKAARYRELTQQLTQKRWELGWVEVQLLRHQRKSLLEQLDETNANKVAFAEQWEGLVARSETEKATLLSLQEDLHELQQSYMAAEREAISAESGYKSANARADELESEKTVIAERLVILQERAATAVVESSNRRQELASLEQEKIAVAAELSIREAELAGAKASLSELDESIEQETNELAALTNSIHELKSKVVGYQFHIEQFQNSIDDLRNQELSSQTEMQAFESEVAELIAGAQRVRLRADEARENRIDATRNLGAQRLELAERQEQYSAMQAKLHGVRERLAVLKELEDQFEGDECGGQQLLRLARQNQSDPNRSGANSVGATTGNPWNSVRGLVADIVRSEMHLAPLIDVALGPLADAIVLSSGEIVDWVHQGSLKVDGRVTLLRLDRLPNRRTGEKIQLDGLRGVIGRADRLTQFTPEYEPLIRALLGTTWIVDSLATALELSHFRGAGLRFVTAECQLVDSDGSITIGSLQAGLELISRRTEMQKAIEEIEERERELDVIGADVTSFLNELQRDEFLLKALEEDERSTSQELSRVEIQSESIEQRRDNWRTKLVEIANQIELATKRIAEVETQAQESDRSCQEAEQEREQKLIVIQKLKDSRIALQAEVQQKLVLTSDQKIALARLEQRFDGLQLALQQMVIDADEREKSAAQASQSLAALTQRAGDLRENAINLQTSMGELKEKAVKAEALRIEQVAKIDIQNNLVSELTRDSDQLRRSIEKNDDKLNSLDQTISQAVTQLSELCIHYVREHNIRLPVQLTAVQPTTSSDEAAAEISTTHNDFRADSDEEPDVAVSQLDSMELLTSADAWVEAMEGMALPTETFLEEEPEVIEEQQLDAAPEYEEQELAPEFVAFQEKLEAIDRLEELSGLKNRIDSEISSLRNELAATGSVNMEALAELDAFQDRYDRLAGHQNDLIAAKDGLIKTMAKIDEDSRHLFMETLQSIRANFQDLYRRSFGGGFADIVLDNENDPDSGIEIIATPPGKTTLSNSLLSGGEKALTAVALIMAFFQYRPSPFCILDEVDAPFDEANIGRFVTVLKEFLSTTKFIVVSHSKKTMTAANMIYGVTMQESGVSRQVSVRFEEVNEKGEVITKDRKLAA